MRRKLLIAVPLLFLVALAAWMLRPRRETLGEAFVSEKVASLLSGIAQVREPVGTLHYGERVDVVGKRNDYVKVRTNAGTVGWVQRSPATRRHRWPAGGSRDSWSGIYRSRCAKERRLQISVRSHGSN